MGRDSDLLIPSKAKTAERNTKTEMKRTLETLACLALCLALVAILSAVALGFCGYFG